MKFDFVRLVESTNRNRVLKYEGRTVLYRFRNVVGKDIGGAIYVHKNYADDAIKAIPRPVNPDKRKRYEFFIERYKTVMENFADKVPFKYNCMKLDYKNLDIRFDEAPDFDTAREPITGRYFTVKPDDKVVGGTTHNIWHHKWLWVKDDYKGFDVEESHEWSNTWYPMFKIKRMVASGSKPVWEKQLKQVGLV
jgi:hypothetical protein